MHDKIQRFSLRKLSVGLASVAIGTCIFSANGKTVKADVTSDQTTQKADVQGQTATAQAQNGKQQTSSAQNSVADQSQKNLLDDLGKQKASTENNQAEAKNQENRLVDQINYKLTNNTSTDHNQDLGQNKVAPDKTKSNPTTKNSAEKSIVGSSSTQQVNNQSNDHADDNSQPQNEQKLDLTKNSKKLAKKVLATNLIETTNTNPVKKSQVELTIKGATMADQSKLPDKIGSTIGSNFLLGFNGQFTIDGSAFNKKDNQIKLAEITESNNFNTFATLNSVQPDWTCTYNGQTIGWYHMTKPDGHHLDLMLHITSNQDFIGDVTLNTSVPSLFQYGATEAPSNYKGVTRDHPFVSTLSVGNHSYQFIYVFDSTAYHEVDYSDKKTDTWQNGSNAGAESGYIPFISDSYNKTDIIHELENSHGKTMSAKLQNLKRVVQLSGSHLPQNISGYDIVWLDQGIQVIDANGKLTDESIGAPRNNNITIIKVALPDNLTPQEVYDQTPENTYGFSKQKDGSFIIGWNFSPLAYKMNSTDLANDVRVNSKYANLVDPAHKDQIVQNTVDFYEGALQGTPLQKTSGIFISLSESTDFTIKDLTPGDNRHLQDTGFIKSASSSSEGETAKYVSVQVVDDDNNQMTIHNSLLRGKAGDTEKIEYTIPDHYQLIDGQNIPNTYVLKDSNQPIIIHLKHVRSNINNSNYLQTTGKRTITVYLPHQDKPMIIIQTVGYKRTGTYDEVIEASKGLDEAEKEGNYTDWVVDADTSNVTVDGQSSTQYQAYVLKDGVVNYAPIKLPHINGYKVKFIQDKANPAMFMVSFVALPQQNNQLASSKTQPSDNVQSPQKPAQAEQKQLEPAQTAPAEKQEQQEVAQILNHIAYDLMHNDSSADSFEPVQDNSDSLEAPSDSTQKVNAAKPKKHIVKKRVVKRHKKHAKKYHLKRRSRKHSKRSKKRIIKHRKSVSRKFRKHNLKHVKKN